MPKSWYLKNPKYFGNEQKFVSNSHDSSFQELLEVAPESYDIKINEVPTKAIIQSIKGKRDDIKRISTMIGEIQLGDVVNYKKLTWLVTTFTDDNKMHSYGNMELCKSDVAFQGEPLKIKTGNDPSGRPIYEVIQGQEYSYPSVVSNTLKSKDLNDGVNLPTGMVSARIRYVDNKEIAPNKLCKIFEQQYKIVDVDITNTYLAEDGERMGVINILANKVQRENE